MLRSREDVLLSGVSDDGASGVKSSFVSLPKGTLVRVERVSNADAPTYWVTPLNDDRRLQVSSEELRERFDAVKS